MTSPPPDLIDNWAASLVPLEGETETQRRVRALSLNGSVYERDRRLAAAKAQYLADLRTLRANGDHSVELKMFEGDLLAYAERPSRAKAERLLWSTHTIRFTYGDDKARELWAACVSGVKRPLPRITEIRKRWKLPSPGDATHYF